MSPTRDVAAPGAAAEALDLSEAAPASGGEIQLVCYRCGAAARPTVSAISAAGLELTCRRCGASISLPLAVENTPRPEAQPGCPKCGAPRAAEACPRCGLVYERWQGAKRVTSTDRIDTERLWRDAAGDFLSPQRHAVFIAHCLHAGELPYAVARYADESRSADPERARVARERRRQVAALAEVMWLTPARSAQRHDSMLRRLLRLIGGVGVVMMFASSALALGGTMVGRSAVAAPPSAAAPAGAHPPSRPFATPVGGKRP